MTLELTASCDELSARFLELKDAVDVANLLDVQYELMIFHLYISNESGRYKKFPIPKRTGGMREILAPVTALKILQRKLAQVLQCVYERKPPVHGFVNERSIVTNAEPHCHRRYVLNVDLKNFFPTINFGRVYGLFMAHPYNLPAEAATVLAQICCHDNQLPQGAPTSPIVSNFICAKMDRQLLRLAERHRCFYTRYADDLTFSTSLNKFPPNLAKIVLGSVKVGDELLAVIEGNGFEVNEEKVRLQTRNQRQEVTGLTVNRFPNVKRTYVRQIRAMLHAWRKYGLETAQQEYWERYLGEYQSSVKELPSFRKVVRGKIEFLGMVRGKDNLIYKKYLRQYALLDPDANLEKLDSADMSVNKGLVVPKIYTEGKTDWKHLKKAFQTLRSSGEIDGPMPDFEKFEEDMGDQELLKMCTIYAKESRPKPIIFIFDADKQDIVKKVSDENNLFRLRKWGNNVFSFVLPVPDHRSDSPDISIEFYYSDEEIKRKDQSGRRLFLSTEFHPSSGKHREDKNLNCSDRNRYGRKTLCIIDNDVFNEDNQNVALSKNDFAENVLHAKPNFNDFDVTYFKKVYDVILEIMRLAQ